MDESLLEASTAWALLRKGRIQLIDIRRRDAVGAPRVPGARLIPLDELPRELVTLDRERPLVLISWTGGTAAETVRVLRLAGISARAVDGGLRGWVDAGLPVDRSAAAGRRNPQSEAGVVADGAAGLQAYGESIG